MAKNRCNPGPRNLRNAENYSVGLDLGTGSVGWAVVDENGELYRVNGNKPTWGSRLFPSAETAANTRKKRGQRRRYERRRQRIDTLQQVFCEEMSKVDPAFFIRMRQSRLFKDDRDPQFETDYDHPFFNGTDFTESDYYATYPTIWHLRKHLMETARTGEKADLRLIYLALHNIVKYRGNFLHENEGRELTAAHANALQAATDLVETLQDYLADLDEDSDSYGTECAPDIAAIEAALDKPGIKRQERVEKLEEALHFSAGRTVIGKVIAKACIGYKAIVNVIYLCA